MGYRVIVGRSTARQHSPAFGQVEEQVTDKVSQANFVNFAVILDGTT